MQDMVLKKIVDCVQSGIKNIYIYPYGMRGQEIYRVLKNLLDDILVVRVDDSACKINSKIIPYNKMIAAEGGQYKVA